MAKKDSFFPKEISHKKEFNCNNKCRSNCCSEIFLILNEENEKRLKVKRELIYDKDYTDWRWVGYHKGISANKYGKEMMVSIDEKVDYEIHHNPHFNSNMVLIKSKCKMLLPTNRCRIFRARPKICRVAECPVYSGKENLKWYAEHTELKELLKDGV